MESGAPMKTFQPYGMNHAAHVDETDDPSEEKKELQDEVVSVKDGLKVQETSIKVPQDYETTCLVSRVLKENDELKKEIQKLKMILSEKRPPKSSSSASFQVDGYLTEKNPLKEKKIGMNNSYSSTLPTDNNHDDENCCDCFSEDDDESCNSVFDTIPFNQVLTDRASWLFGLLVFQSLSSFILEKNDDMLASHLDIVHFLTMLVGAGGNAGNQASVRVIRGLAVGTLNHRSMKNFIVSEMKMTFCIGGVLALAGLLRATMFAVPFPETVAITASLWMIVVISIILGVILPLSMKYVGIDPAHSSTTIQVVMDIIGVTITCGVSQLILDTTMGHNFVSMFTKLRG